MKKCPFCGAEMSDDSLFCTECGKELSKGNKCPHCGATVSDGDAFCEKCGKKITESPNEEVITNDVEKKSSFKKFMPYIIGAIALLMIIGYYSSNQSSEESRNEDGVEQVTDSKSSDKVNDNSEQEIQAKKDFLEKFYKEKNGREQSDEYAYIKKNVTANGFQILKDLYDFECDGECLATWAFDYEEGSDIGDFKSRNILSQDDNNFLVESEYEYAKYSVLLTVVKEGDTYKIDRIEQKGTISLVSEQMKTENLDWLQGHWVYQQGNYKGHFVIQGNTLTMYSSMNPEPLTYTYRVEGNELFAGEMTVKLNFGSQTIDYGDGNWMQKVE